MCVCVRVCVFLRVYSYDILFLFFQVKLVFSGGALDAIAELATEKKTGARGLRSIMVGNSFFWCAPRKWY